MAYGKKFVVVRLAGGLGNQMFQYAMGRSLALRSGASLGVDTWSGFARDHEYKRTYELGQFPIAAHELTVPSPRVLVGTFIHARRRLFQGSGAPEWVQRLTGRVTTIVEAENRLRVEVLDTRFNGTCWLDGYWQSPGYFEDIAEDIECELRPPVPSDAEVRNLGRKMSDINSLAVGIRLYEESRNPAAHAHEGRIKSAVEIQRALDTLMDREPEAQPFVFCTHRADFLDEIVWPQGTQFVTHEDGSTGALQRLWLLTQCKHHLMTNSTFYWWGAWLSKNVHVGSQQQIFASDNFINPDSVPSEWATF